ncbi:MAG TPA: L,D-transpeptidase [Chroococcidiopsis sp.]
MNSSKTIRQHSQPHRQRRVWHRLSVAVCLSLTTALGWAAPALLSTPAAAVRADENWIANAVEELKNSGDRWIQIDLSSQTLTAWEGDQPVYSVSVSTGRAGERTPTGVFEIQSMHRTARMTGPNYDIPDVPYVMYYDGNYGIHGTYWHNSFGTPVSNGCTNVAVNHAAWLFDWASYGTPVVVQR